MSPVDHAIEVERIESSLATGDLFFRERIGMEVDMTDAVEGDIFQSIMIFTLVSMAYECDATRAGDGIERLLL